MSTQFNPYYKENFYWKFNDKEFTLPVDPDENISFKFSSPIDDVLSPDKEFDRSANLLKKEYGTENLMLMYSGGLDSQAIAYSFIKAGIEFENLCIVYKKKDKILNERELRAGNKFINKFNIKTHYVEIDFKERIPFYAEIAKGYAPIQFSFYSFIDAQLKFSDRFFIRGTGDLGFLYPMMDTDSERKIILALDHSHYTNQFGLNGIYQYYKYHPNLVFSMVFNPVVQNFKKNFTKFRTFFDKTSKNTYEYSALDPNYDIRFSGLVKNILFKKYFGSNIYLNGKEDNEEVFDDFKELESDFKNRCGVTSFAKMGTRCSYNDVLELYQSRDTYKIFSSFS